MPTSFALGSDYDIQRLPAGGIATQTDATALARDRIRIILGTVLGTIPLHPTMGLPVEPMVRSASPPFIQGAIERAIREQEGDIARVDFPRTTLNPATGEVSLDVNVELQSGRTISESGVTL